MKKNGQPVCCLCAVSCKGLCGAVYRIPSGEPSLSQACAKCISLYFSKSPPGFQEQRGKKRKYKLVQALFGLAPVL